MKTSSPSVYTSSPVRSGRSKIAGGLAIAVLSLGLAFSAQATEGFTEEDDRVRGNPQATLTLLEYSDFTCGYCEKFFQDTWPILFSEYIDTGKMRLVYRDFPRAPKRSERGYRHGGPMRRGTGTVLGDARPFIFKQRQIFAGTTPEAG